jgi:hypothetical protein
LREREREREKVRERELDRERERERERTTAGGEGKEGKVCCCPGGNTFQDRRHACMHASVKIGVR